MGYNDFERMFIALRIYLDNCCLNRPFDDLSSDIVRMESEAVLSILDRCESGDWEFFGSDILFDEMSNMPDMVRKQKVMILYQSSKPYIALTDEIVSRANELQIENIKPYDALHLASAEAGGADVFLTTDKKLIAAAERVVVRFAVANPLKWLTEVYYE
jgi:predicted nucleic acid-binding protein